MHPSEIEAVDVSKISSRLSRTGPSGSKPAIRINGAKTATSALPPGMSLEELSPCAVNIPPEHIVALVGGDNSNSPKVLEATVTGVRDAVYRSRDLGWAWEVLEARVGELVSLELAAWSSSSSTAEPSIATVPGVTAPAAAADTASSAGEEETAIVVADPKRTKRSTQVQAAWLLLYAVAAFKVGSQPHARQVILSLTHLCCLHTCVAWLHILSWLTTAKALHACVA